MKALITLSAIIFFNTCVKLLGHGYGEPRADGTHPVLHECGEVHAPVSSKAIRLPAGIQLAGMVPKSIGGDKLPPLVPSSSSSSTTSDESDDDDIDEDDPPPSFSPPSRPGTLPPSSSGGQGPGGSMPPPTPPPSSAPTPPFAPSETVHSASQIGTVAKVEKAKRIKEKENCNRIPSLRFKQ